MKIEINTSLFISDILKFSTA